jgi:chromosome segregation ATPase
MPAKTNSDKIDDLVRDQAALSGAVKSDFARFEKQQDRHTAQIDKLQDTCTQILARLAAIEQRLANVEKMVDEIRARRWQFYLILVGWLVTLVGFFIRR